MAHAPHLRAKAIVLRKQRKLTIDEIADRLALSRSTIYYWVRHIPIPATVKQTAAQRRRARANSERHRLIREAEYERGFEEFMEFIRVPTFRDFVVCF
jgi:transposase